MSTDVFFGTGTPNNHSLWSYPVDLCNPLPKDPFGEKRGRFDYQGLLTRLGATHLRIREKTPAEDEHNGDSDSNSSSSETDPDSQGSSQP